MKGTSRTSISRRQWHSSLHTLQALQGNTRLLYHLVGYLQKTNSHLTAQLTLDKAFPASHTNSLTPGDGWVGCSTAESEDTNTLYRYQCSIVRGQIYGRKCATILSWGYTKFLIVLFDTVKPYWEHLFLALVPCSQQYAKDKKQIWKPAIAYHALSSWVWI